MAGQPLLPHGRGALGAGSRPHLRPPIHADALADLAASSRRTALLIGDQPGAGKAQAASMVRNHLSRTVRAAVSISGDQLREYHPHCRQAPLDDVHAGTDLQKDVGRWVARLTGDAMAAGVNVVTSNTKRDARTVTALTSSFTAVGYEVAAVVLVTTRDRSRQATLARYGVARSAGLTPGSFPLPCMTPPTSTFPERSRS